MTKSFRGRDPIAQCAETPSLPFGNAPLFLVSIPHIKLRMFLEVPRSRSTVLSALISRLHRTLEGCIQSVNDSFGLMSFFKVRGKPDTRLNVVSD